MLNNMSSFRYEKTYTYAGSKKDLISVKKYLVAKDEEDQKYAVFHLINNYKEAVNSITIEVKQFDSEKKLLATNVIPYEDLNIKSGGKFVPFVKLALDEHTDSVETKVTEAKFENHVYQNRKLIKVKKVKEPKKEETKVLKDSITYDVKSLNSKYPVKSFMILSAIVLILTAIFVGFFSLTNKTIVIDEIGFDSATGTITKYYGESNSVVIPKKIKNTTVNTIGAKAFSGSSVSYIEIEGNIEIENYAFSNCLNLKEIGCDGIVAYIGDYAFQNCSVLENVNFNGVETVGTGAFKKCKNLEYFESDTCSWVGTEAFVDCINIESVVVPHATITNMTFENNIKLQELVFGDVASLYQTTLSRIFSNTNTHTNLSITTNVKDVRLDFIDGFEYNRLNFVNPEVKFEAAAKTVYELNAKNDDAYVSTYLYTKLYDTIIEFDTSAISENLVINDPTIKGIMIDSLLTSGSKVQFLYLNCGITVNNKLLSCFPNLTELNIGTKCSIDKGAIFNMKLQKITMPVLNTKFADNFYVLPSSLEVELVGYKAIPDEYFDGTSAVTKINVSGYISTIGVNAFKNCIGLTELEIGHNVTKMGKPMITDCFVLKTVTLPLIGTEESNPIKYVELNQSGAFTTTLYINNQRPITLVKDCFENCSAIQTLYIEGGITGDTKDILKGLTKIKKLLIAQSCGSTLVDMFGSSPTLEYIAIDDAELPKEYFKGLLISNLFLKGNVMISDDSFTNNDLINKINISSNVYFNPVNTKKAYNLIFEDMVLLKQINFEKSSISYTGKKAYTTSYDFNNAYELAFNK